MPRELATIALVSVVFVAVWSGLSLFEAAMTGNRFIDCLTICR